MTNFAVQSMVGPVIGSLASKDKGSAGNRADCAGQHIKNNVVTMAQGGLAGAAALGGGYVVAHNAKATDILAKGTDKALDLFQKTVKRFSKSKPTAIPTKFANQGKNIKVITGAFSDTACTLSSKVNQMFAKLNIQPDTAKKLKALAPIALVATALTSYISNKHNYKMGQIDQKYTDKAQVQKTLA